MTIENFNTDRGLALLTVMERIRAFEEQACLAAERDKLVLGAIHPSIGQEAVAAGVMASVNKDDILLSTHRGHGHTLAKGASSVAMMRELLGREGGCCGGKGGSMHIADFNVGMLGANGVVSANITIAAGAAHGIKLLGDNRIVVDIFGDGAINRGPFLEGLNWSTVFGLPILFVCEDNQYSATTKTSNMTGGEGSAARAAAIGLRASTVDGNNAEAVADVTAEICSRLRAGGKPEFLHAVTYRQTGHTSFDQAAYRPEGEAAKQTAENDPIARQRDILLTAGVSDQAMTDIRGEAQAEMIEALRLAAASPFPDNDKAFLDVQDLGSPAVEAY
jgi:acetoin:2,6-dichlorophenolindophenol oxidoreductase subunit alpha